MSGSGGVAERLAYAQKVQRRHDEEPELPVVLVKYLSAKDPSLGESVPRSIEEAPAHPTCDWFDNDQKMSNSPRNTNHMLAMLTKKIVFYQHAAMLHNEANVSRFDNMKKKLKAAEGEKIVAGLAAEEMVLVAEEKLLAADQKVKRAEQKLQVIVVLYARLNPKSLKFNINTNL